MWKKEEEGEMDGGPPSRPLHSNSGVIAHDGKYSRSASVEVLKVYISHQDKT
jgi:hypothetical protein